MVSGPAQIDPIVFDKRRFRTAASHYLAGRPGYAPKLIERVAGLCGLGRQDRVLDLGCGPGQLAIAFAPLVADVLAIDPEPEMLRAARARAPANVHFLEDSSYGLGLHLGRFRLAAMGRSFHWMDRVETLRRLEEIIEPDGAVALFGDSHPELPENAWRAEFRALLDRYGTDDAYHRRRDPNWVPHTTILFESAFCAIEEIAVVERRETRVGVLVDRALSMSSTSRARIGDRADAMVAEIETLMARLAPSGTFVEVVASRALIARRA